VGFVDCSDTEGRGVEAVGAGVADRAPEERAPEEGMLEEGMPEDDAAAVDELATATKAGLAPCRAAMRWWEGLWARAKDAREIWVSGRTNLMVEKRNG